MKICLAGTYAATLDTRPYLAKMAYILESFYYINDWQLPYTKQKELFLLDSGAFTFMSNQHEGSKVDFDKYLTEYTKFINKHDIKYFFELDIDVVVGYERVKELRARLERETGKKCIPVWHKSRGLDEWVKMTEDYDYVAIGGIVTKEIKSTEYKYFTPLLEIAKKNNCRVHGLGFTSIKNLEKYKFYSVDSTSWKSGGRFGTLYKFENGTMYQIKKPDGFRAKSKNGWYSKIELFNCEAWVKFQKYADTHL